MFKGKRLIHMILMMFCLIIISPLSAAVVRSMPTSITQPDGTVLQCFVSGDEYHNWLHDKDNYTIIPDPQTGYYCYADRQGNGIVASSLIAGRDNPQSRNLSPGINISTADYKQLRASKFPNPEPRDAPTIGTINNIVIYIRFSDETEFGQLNSIYDGWFNTSTSSQKGYFLEASYNQLTVNTSFYPAPQSGYVVSWQASNPRAYYKPYDATTNPTGYNGDVQRTLREHALLRDAVNGVSSQVPADLTIDSDNDGRVDNVVFIVKGDAGAWSSLLWPHRWSLYTYTAYIRGKRVYDYNFQLQNFLASRGVGVICHEFFHTLGAPDLYHYTDNGIDPAGSWDIMESDQNPPQHMTAFMKYKYGHWISSIPVISTDGVYTLNPLTSSTGNAYRINSNNANQYYMVEFRKKTGTYENSIPGSGMLIYRIDTSCGNGNADGPPDELYIYRPNGTTTVNGTLSSANYSSQTGRIKIDNTTNPTPFLQDGSAGNLYLCEIGSSAGTTMSFRRGAPFIDFSVNPYAQTFDATAFPPEGWVNQAISGTYVWQRVTTGSNPGCSPQSGAGMVRYNSDIAPSGNAALLATPRMVCNDLGIYGYRVSFWMFRDGNLTSTLDRMEVYLNSVQGLGGTPTLLGTIHRSRTQSPTAPSTGWYQYSFNLPVAVAGNYYAVFKGISESGYNIFMDSMQITKYILPPNPAINPSPSDTATGINYAQLLSWQSGSNNPSSYKMYLGTNNPPTNLVNGQVLGNVLSYTHPGGLLLGTQYYWKIVPTNEGGEAANCPVWTFTTLPDTSVFPMVEDFGSTGATFPPLNWTRYSGVLANPSTLTANTTYWVQDDWANTPETPPNFSARMNIYSTNRYGWLISPFLHIPAGAKLEFDLALTDYANSNPISSDPNGTTGTDDQFAVLIGDGTSWTPANLLRLWDNASSAYVYNNIPHTGQRVVIDLSAVTGYKYIAFYGASTTSNADNDLFVDNVAITITPTTPQLHISPTVWNAGTILMNSTSTQQFTITNGGAANLVLGSINLSGDMAFSLSGIPGMPHSIPFGASLTFTSTYHPTTLGEHSATITISDNRLTSHIQLSGISFDARIASLPSLQDFDGVATPALPLGWNTVISSTSTSAYVRTTTSYPVSFPNTAYLTNSTDATADLRLVSPEVLVPLNTARLRFSARGGSTGYTLLVGTMDSPTGTFTQLAALDLTNVHTIYTVSLAASSATDHYLAFKHALGGTSRSIYIDDILIEAELSNDFMVSGLSGSGIGIVGTETQYQISVTNNGTTTQSSYTVKLLSQDSRLELASLEVNTPLAPDATAVHTLGWTPSAADIYTVYAEVVLPGDDYASNNTSPPEPAHIYPSDTAIPFAGDPQSTTTVNYLPLNMYFKNSVTETIYTASELQLSAGQVQAIVYYNSFVQDLLAKPVKIWMKNTTEADLSTGWLGFEGYTLVFDGTVDFPSGTNAVVIPLSSIFQYTGGNLAVRVNRPMDSVFYNTGNHFFYHSSPETVNRSRYLQSDSTAYDPAAPSAAGTISSFVPLTAFAVGNYVPLILAAPTASICSDGTELTLSWNAVQGANAYNVYSSSDPTQWNEPPVTVSGATLLSLAPAADRQFYKVVAVYNARALSPVNFLPAKQASRKLSAEEMLPQSRNKD